jgi:hypothetical protein
MNALVKLYNKKLKSKMTEGRRGGGKFQRNFPPPLALVVNRF